MATVLKRSKKTDASKISPLISVLCRRMLIVICLLGLPSLQQSDGTDLGLKVLEKNGSNLPGQEDVLPFI